MDFDQRKVITPTIDEAKREEFIIALANMIKNNIEINRINKELSRSSH